MANPNPFPESKSKQKLREIIFKILAEFKGDKEGLVYFGLPSDRMLDIRAWLPILSQVNAVERVPAFVDTMCKVSEELGIRHKTIVLEMELADAARLLSVDSQHFEDETKNLFPHERNKLKRFRQVFHDIINLDMCGGFVYRKEDHTPENVEILQNLFKAQSRIKKPFILIITYNLKDVGGKDYDEFIRGTMQFFKGEPGAEEVEQYYLDPKIKVPSPQVRKLKFSVPLFLLNEAHKQYYIRSYGAWNYSSGKTNLFNTVLRFEPLTSKSVFARTWPPIDEVKAILKAPLYRIIQRGESEAEVDELDVPYFH